MEIELNNVSYKKYLKNINIIFKSQLINGIIGPSGSGKTCLLELIDLLIVPTKGNVYIDKVIFNKTSNINEIRKNIGFVFQFPEEQFFNTTVKKELEVALNFYGNKKDIKKLISDTLKMVDLDESLLQRDPFTLSSGEKRKLAIASILIYNPKIILMDEPTIGLDYKSRENLIKIIRNLKTEYKKTIIIVSNDVDLIHKISDYIYILKEGNLLLSGNKYDVFKNTKLLRENNINIPKLIEFSDYVLINKRIKIGYRDEINDLIKDIYRYAK